MVLHDLAISYHRVKDLRICLHGFQGLRRRHQGAAPRFAKTSADVTPMNPKKAEDGSHGCMVLPFYRKCPRGSAGWKWSAISTSTKGNSVPRNSGGNEKGKGKD